MHYYVKLIYTSFYINYIGLLTLILIKCDIDLYFINYLVCTIALSVSAHILCNTLTYQIIMQSYHRIFKIMYRITI